MRINFVLPDADLSGGIRVISIYADRLRKRGHEVFVVSQPLEVPRLTAKVRSFLRGKGWPSSSQTKPTHFDGLDVPHRTIESPRAIRDDDVPDADVAIATWWQTAEWVAQLSPQKGTKVYFIQHHEIHHQMPEQRVRATWRLPLYKITVSRWLVDLAATEYGDRDVSLVPNSVDTEQFYAPSRSKQPIPTVGVMYSPVPWKGCDISFKAFEIARQKIPNLQLVTFGSQLPCAELPLPAKSDFFYQPAQDRIKDIYARCDAWLFSSRSEGFGLPILEAMACRTPVIATSTGAAPELVGDGGGILVPLEDPEAMAREIERICLLTDSQWRTLSEAAYARVTGYSWDDATDLFEAALYTAIDRTRASPI